MRRLAGLLVMLAACSFDGSGTTGGGGGDDDGAPAIDGGSIADVDARPPIDAAPPPPPDAPPPDAWLDLGCDFDFQCEAGEADIDWCPDCDQGGGGGFVCDFDSMCEPGESDECLDCLGQP